MTPVAALALRSQSDRRLVRLAREGYDAAFAELVRRYRPGLVSYAASFVTASAAEDVVQDAFARAYEALGRADEIRHPRAWLYRIVRNAGLNMLRDDRPHDELDDDFDGVAQPPEIVAREAQVAAILAGLERLPDAQREALVAREFEGRSHEEIAADLHTSPGSVRGLILRARQTLRAAVGALLPVPLLRALLSGAEGPVELTGAAASAGMGATFLGGGSGGVAAKVGVAAIAAVVAGGSGAAIIGGESGGAPDGPQRDAAAQAGEGERDRRGEPGSLGGGHAELVSRSERRGAEAGADDGRSHADGEGDRRGADRGDRDAHDGEGPSSSSGPGPGADGDGDGHGGGGSGPSGSGSGPSGSGSGPSGSGSGSSGSGSGSSGSGSGSSGSGSGSSGSGSGSSGSGSGHPDDGEPEPAEEPELEPDGDSSGPGSGASERGERDA